MARILIADDEEGLRLLLSEILRDDGHDVVTACDGQAALEALAKGSFHLLLTDLKMPRVDGMTVLRHARSRHPEMEVLVLSAHGSIAGAVEATKLGAFDYLVKPLESPAALRTLVGKALERRALRDLAARAEAAGPGDDALTFGDPAMGPVLAALQKVAPTDATVLLVGESGVGKEVAARAVHRWSRRSAGPFVAINCAALADNLLESELFGHERGAFTGATQRRRGKIELADGGTFFLDEVGELRLELQAKLLRVVQERRFERVGGTQTLTADVRWLAATNRDLHAQMRAGKFREDLYHRLAVFPVTLPPLRQRRQDILPLADRLLTDVAGMLHKGQLILSDAARAVLVAHDWPGNVRELRNALERAAILTDGPTIDADHLQLGAPSGTAMGLGSVRDGAGTGSMADAERAAILAALAAEGGHRKRAARRLGIGLRTLYDKLKAYGIT